MKKKILAVTLAITTVFTGIAWPWEVSAEELYEESQTETETPDGTEDETMDTELEITGTLGIFSGIMGEKVTFSIDNGTEGLSYEWRYTEGENIDNNNYSILYRGEFEAEVMITKETAANTYWCHITDANGNEADTIPCRLVCELDENYVANGICGENIAWTLDANGQLTLNGTGGFNLSDVSWRGYEEQIISASIGEGITEIGLWTFSQIKTLEQVSLPESLKIIGDYAFYKTGLIEITFPDGLEEIGERAFQEAMGAVRDGVYLPDGLKKIGKSAFLDGGMEFIFVPSSVTEIGDYAFDGVVSIRCEEGSYAEEYAIANDASYEVVTETKKDENTTTFPIENCTVTLEAKSYYYDGFEKEPAVTVVNGEMILKQGVDYTVSYQNNIKIGTAVVTITGIGNYTGSKMAFLISSIEFMQKMLSFQQGHRNRSRQHM